MALTLSSNNFEVNIHPVALFNIVHGYERRSEKCDNILGTLLGTRTADSIEVVDSFVVPHSTSGDALYNVDYASTMANFYRKVNSTQTTVGW
jgi:translation initiation factor 3 subunit F